MEVYIRKSIAGYFAEFPEEIDSVYWQGKIGSTYQDFEQNKWIHLTPEQVEFHINNPFATIKEVLEMIIFDNTIEEAKTIKIEFIKEYDESEAINSFNVSTENGDISAWLTPAERSNYRSSIDASKLIGLSEVSLYIGDILITLSINTAELMLAQIQLYADACANVTKHHILTIESLQNVDDINRYDFTIGYPQRLSFTI